MNELYRLLTARMNRLEGDLENLKICNVDVRRLCEDAKFPVRATIGASGYDLYSTESRTLEPGERYAYGTGLAFAIPFGWEGQIRPRSGLSLKGICVANSPGTIDSDYRGEVRIILVNHTKDHFYPIEKGDRIAQIVFAHTADHVRWYQIDHLSETGRGNGGFGSTGTGVIADAK